MGKGIELKGHKKKKANANVDRERESPMRALRAKCSAIVWETWWCGESTKLLTFQFFYCYGTNKPYMCGDEN